MAATAGKDGGIVVNGSTVTFMDSWDLSLTAETKDTTSYGDTARTRIQVFKDWSVNVKGTLDRSDTMQAALLDQFEDGTLAAVLLQLKTAASAYWYGSAVLKSGSVNSKVDDKVSVSFSFESSGALNHTA